MGFRIFVPIIAFIIVAGNTFGQGIQIREHGEIRPLMDKYKSLNQNDPFVQGWRIQIITTDDRRRMERAIYQFRNLYPGMNPDWVHISPYYQVKVGAFRDKLDYQNFLLELKQHFPSAIPIMEKLYKEELLRD